MIEFVVSLADKVSPSAKVAESSLVRLTQAQKEAKATLTSYAQQLNLAKSIGDVEGYRTYTAAVDAQKRKLFEVNQAVLDAKSATSEAAPAAMSFGDAMGALAGPASIAATALVAVTAAVGALIVAGGKLALEQVELKNQLTATFEALGRAPGAGAATVKALDALSDQLGVTREAIAPTAKAFEAMGITDLSALQNQIKATAGITATLGDSAASAYQGVVARAQEAVQTGSKLKIADKQITSFRDFGVSIDDLAAKMGTTAKALRTGLTTGTVNAAKFQAALAGVAQTKFGGALEEQAGSLSNQFAKFKENIGRFFEDVNVQPFLDAMKDLLGTFSQSTASGQAMKTGITGAFNGVFSIASKVVPYVKHFFLDLVILGLKAYIALKPLIAGIKDFWQQHDGLSVLENALKGVGVVLAGVGIAIGLVLTPFLVMGAALAAVGVAFVTLAGTIATFVGTAASALADFASSGIAVATNFVSGLIQGITAGVSKAVDAVKGLGSSLVDGVKGVLGIHSPSAVMMQLGAHTATGFAQGVAGGSGAIQSSAAGLGDAATSGASSSGGGGGGVVVNVGGIVINGAGKGAEELTEEAVSLIFERLAAAQGLG